MNADASAEAKFQEEVAANLTRNYVSQLAHGMLAMTGFRLVNAPTFVPAYLYLLSGSTTVVGLALSAQHFGAFFSSVFGATAIEHRRRIVGLGIRYGWMMRLSVLGLALAGFFLPPNITLYVFAAFLGLLGVFSGMQNVLWNVLLTKTIPADRRGMMIGLRNFLGGMTAAGVAFVGGKYLVETDMLGNGYASTFLLAFLLTSAGLTLLYFVREPDAPSVRPAVSVGERLADIPSMLRHDPAFAMYFWAQALATLGTLAMPFYILFAGKTLGLTGGVLASLSLALLVSQTAANLIWGALADRLGFKAVFVPALLLWAGATIALIVSKEQNSILFCFVGIGAGYSGYLIAAQNMVLEFGSRADLPLRIAMVNSAQSLVQALGPIAGGIAASALGFEIVFAAAVLAKLAAAGMLWLYVREPRDNRLRGEVGLDAGEGFDMSVGDGAAIPPNAAGGANRTQSGGTSQAAGASASGAAVPDRKRPKSPMGVRLDDIKWTLISAWLALAILAMWTGQWMFCLVLGLAITAFALARLGYVRSLPDVAAPSTPMPAPAAKVEAVLQPRPTVIKADYVPSDIVRCLPDPAILTDQTGRIVAVNDSLEQVFGVAEPRKHLASVIRAPQVLGALDQVLAGRGAQRVEFPIVSSPEQMFEAYITPIEGDDRSLRAALIVLRDLTKAQRVEQMRADFVANASHELRTPLASLTGFIDTLRGHAKDDPEAQERFLGIMAEQATRMRRLIDDLLSLTRIELNEHVRPGGSVNIGDVIEEIANAMSPVAQAANMQIDIVEPSSLPNVVGDRDELYQVFQNLVDNAIKYGRPQTAITIELGTRRAAQGEPGPSPAVYVSVSDRGEGIAREHLPRLTERFYRVDVRRSRAIGGTGLGLAIVKHIVNRHRGRIAIESKPDYGSTFTVFLPLATQAGVGDMPPTGLLTAS
ncbi:MAG: MFS transporter [Alphaproteobacteria bacterium]|nr:MFS transporter [Alphaproteobacteria bacterium]